MPYFKEIPNQVFRVLTTDNKLQYIYNYYLSEEVSDLCKVYNGDGKYDFDNSCLDSLHVDNLIDQLKGRNPLLKYSATGAIKVSDSTIHYLVDLLLFVVCLILYAAYANKTGHNITIQDLFRNNALYRVPGYKISFSILEEGVEPPTYSPPRGSPSFASRQRRTMPSKSYISINKPLNLLGRGRFGSVVFEGQFEGSPGSAVKVVQDTSSLVDREIEILRSVKRLDKIISYDGFRKVENRTLICMELALTDIKNFFEKGSYAEEFVLSEREICEQLVKGVKGLHEQKVAHGDLNPKNILATVTNSKPVIKIADFSLSSKPDYLLELNEFKSRLDLEFGWYAPEIYKLDKFGLDNYIKADMYSLGCLIAYIMSRGEYDRPIEFLRNAMILKEDLWNHDHSVSYKEAQTLRCIDLIICLIANDPKDRPSIQSVAKYPALWDEGKSRRFMVAISEYLKTSEGLGKPHPSIRKKKPGKKGFSNRSSKQREPVQVQQPVRNDGDELFPREIISTDGLTEEQTNSLFLRESIRDYGLEFSRKLKWATVLPPQLRKLLSNKFVNYDEECPVALIRLFRNLTNHFRDNRSILEPISVKTEDDLEQFFAKYFPLLLPIVYKTGQEFKSTLDWEKKFYNPNEDMNLHLDGTLCSYSSLFENEWDLWSKEDRLIAQEAIFDLIYGDKIWSDDDDDPMT